MTSVPAPAPTDDDVLREVLECATPALLGRASAITRIRRERSAFASSYASDVVTAECETGEHFQIFLKNFGVTGVTKEAAERRRDRERSVYRDLLAHADLGTAKLYGSVWNDADGRFWLLLEFVNGSELRACDFRYWVLAAKWLGRLEAHFAEHADRLGACEQLVQHDADFFWTKAERAVREVARGSARLAGRLASTMEHCHWIVRLLANQPRTLVHGHYRPCNILVAVDDAGRERICPVDWEQAALGSALYDLALLSDGFEPPGLDRLLAAYRREASSRGVAVCGHEEMRHLIACYRLFLGVHLLGRAAERRFTEDKVAATVGRVEQLQRAISEGRGGV